MTNLLSKDVDYTPPEQSQEAEEADLKIIASKKPDQTLLQKKHQSVEDIQAAIQLAAAADISYQRQELESSEGARSRVWIKESEQPLHQKQGLEEYAQPRVHQRILCGHPKITQLLGDITESP
jgi:hypothetical protein